MELVKVKVEHRPEWYKKHRKQSVTLFREAFIWSEKEEKLYRKLCVGLTLHLCSGYSELGDVKIDLDPEKRADIIADVQYLPLKPYSFDTIIFDPPWFGPHDWKNYEDMIRYISKIARIKVILILGNLFYHLYKPFKLTKVYFLKKISPQVKMVYIWERETRIISSQLSSFRGQITLDGMATSLPRLKPLTRAERRILNYLRSIGEWVSYRTLREVFGATMEDVDRRVRGLHQKGYLDKRRINGKVKFKVKLQLIKKQIRPQPSSTHDASKTSRKTLKEMEHKNLLRPTPSQIGGPTPSKLSAHKEGL